MIILIIMIMLSIMPNIKQDAKIIISLFKMNLTVVLFNDF